MPETQEPPITLYWLNESRARNILYLLEALEAPYQVKVFKRQPTALAPPELKQIHPLGKSPVVTVQRPGRREKQPLVLAESAFIVEYLVEHFGGAEKGVVPEKYAARGEEEEVGEKEDSKGYADAEETESWLRYRYFMHYAEGSLMPNLVLYLILQHVRNPPLPFPLGFVKFIPHLVANAIQSAWLDKQFALHFPFLEDQLKTSPGGSDRGGLCADRMTAADMLISMAVVAAVENGLVKKEECPAIVAYVGRIKEDAAYKRAVVKEAELGGGGGGDDGK